MRRAGTLRMVGCLPTGAGKTVVFAEFARKARRQVLVLAHPEELLQQARDKLQAALGSDRVVALARAGERAPEHAAVVVCSIRSLHEERLARVMRGRDSGLVLSDECHHAVADDNTRALTPLSCFEAGWTGTLLGCTATTQRGDGRPAHDGGGGWLVPLRGFRLATAADLTHLSGAGADFREDELAEAVAIEDLLLAALGAQHPRTRGT